MDPRRFYDLGKWLLANYPTEREADQRTAVSRIYYAAFLYARDQMKSWGCDFQSDRAMHAKVCEGLKYAKVQPLVRIGVFLSKLHEERKVADYDTQDAFDPDLERIQEMFAGIVPELEEKWGYTAQEKQEAARALIDQKITDFEFGVG